MYKKRNFMLPEWFPFDVIMVTRRRYKCAGYHILQYEEKGSYRWALIIPGKPPSDAVSRDIASWTSLSGAVNEITDEYRRLWREIQSLEKEYGKVQP